MVTKLTEREQFIIRKRYYSYGKKTALQEIGNELGLTRERVRQIENEALNKLRSGFKKEGFID